MTSSVGVAHEQRFAIGPRDVAIAAAASAIAIVLYVVIARGLSSPYDYYGRLSEAFMHGRWWLVEAPPWLNELVPCGPGRFCVAYPPLPAVVAIPFVAVFGSTIGQTVASQFFGGLSAGILFLALRALGAPRAAAIGGCVLSALGTTLLFSSADGRAWFAAHAVAVPFSALAVFLAARGGPGWLVGVSIGLAALARLPFAAATPALVYLLARQGSVPMRTAFMQVVSGGAPLGLVYLLYNVARWETPFDVGYTRLAEGDAFFPHGVFSALYLPRHLFAIVMEAPMFVDGSAAFLRFKVIGMSLFLTTPALLFIFNGLRGVRTNGVALACALGAAAALLPDVLHGTVGFAQFGYRFSLDAQPFLIALALIGDSSAGTGWRARPSGLLLIAIGVAVAINVYAAIGILHFGFWVQ